MENELTAIKRFWNLLSLYRKEIYLIYLYAVLNGLVNLSLPLGIQAIINLIQGAQISTSWTILVIFVLIGIFITGIFQVLQLRIVENIQQDIFARASFDFAVRIPKIKLLNLDKIHAPELVNRFFDTLTIQKGLPKILIDFSLALFQVVFGLVLLAIYSPYFIFLGLFLCFIVWLLFKITGQKGLETSIDESTFKYKIAHWLEEIARTNKSFKLNTHSQFHLDKTDDISFNYLEAREKHFSVILKQFKYFVGFKVLLAAGLLVLGSLLVFSEQMNMGQFVASEIIIILIINSIEKIIRIVETIYDVLTALEKIGYVTDLELDNESGLSIREDIKGIEIEALNLEFAFPDMNQKLIKDLSFKIPIGSKVLITGESGTGKSTLLSLIAGFYDFDDGEILFNDIPIKNYDKDDLYKIIGFYFPANLLFEGSILENITLGRKVEDEKVFEVINKLKLREFIVKQPRGMHGFVDPEGRRLPRSIVQKILIARAIIHQPKLLIMEYPLQFVEQNEKNEIIDYILSEENNWTALVVSDYDYWTKKCTQTIELKKRKL